MRQLLSALLLLLLCPAAFAQEYVYVNTDNLILRDRPERQYMVFAILHAPCRLTIGPADAGYKDNKAVHSKFYRVTVSYDRDGIRYSLQGWVMKKYVVKSAAEVKVPGATEQNVAQLVSKADVGNNYSRTGNVKHFNAADFSAPEFKGGEPQALTKAVQRTYHKGPRGGCYYMSSKNTRVYVDSKHCGH